MKKLFLLLLISPLCYAVTSPKDTIEVNIGEGKKVIFVAKTSADLKKMEQYDFNKILKQMNYELKEIPKETNLMVIRDFGGDTFEINRSSESDKNGKARFFKSLELNYYFGFNYADYYSPLSDGLPTLIRRNYENPQAVFVDFSGRLYSSTANRVFQSPYLSVSVGKNYQLNNGNRTKFNMRTALELAASFDRIAPPKSFEEAAYKIYSSEDFAFNPNVVWVGTSDFKSDTVALFRYNNQTKGLETQLKGENGDFTTYQTPPYTVFKTALNLRVVPNVSFYTAKSNRVIAVGLGGYVGMNLLTSVRNKTIETSEPVIQNNMNFFPFTYGLIGELGIWNINFFAQVNFVRIERDRSIVQQVLNSKNEAISGLAGGSSFPGYTFGLRFGK